MKTTPHDLPRKQPTGLRQSWHRLGAMGPQSSLSLRRPCPAIVVSAALQDGAAYNGNSGPPPPPMRFRAAVAYVTTSTEPPPTDPLRGPNAGRPRVWPTPSAPSRASSPACRTSCHAHSAAGHKRRHDGIRAAHSINLPRRPRCRIAPGWTLVIR